MDDPDGDALFREHKLDGNDFFNENILVESRDRIEHLMFGPIRTRLHLIPELERTREICMDHVVKNYNNMMYVPDHLMNEEFILRVIEKSIVIRPDLIPEKCRTERVTDLLLKRFIYEIAPRMGEHCFLNRAHMDNL